MTIMNMAIPMNTNTEIQKQHLATIYPMEMVEEMVEECFTELHGLKIGDNGVRGEVVALYKVTEDFADKHGLENIYRVMSATYNTMWSVVNTCDRALVAYQS